MEHIGLSPVNAQQQNDSNAEKKINNHNKAKSMYNGSINTHMTHLSYYRNKTVLNDANSFLGSVNSGNVPRRRKIHSKVQSNVITIDIIPKQKGSGWKQAAF
jgi:hypothetical protein